MHFFSSFLPSIGHVGVFGYWIAFGLSFVESLPFVGLMFPGTMLVILFGFFASQGLFHFRTLVWFVAIGAILGDVIGYKLGLRGKNLFREGNRFLVRPIRKKVRRSSGHTGRRVSSSDGSLVLCVRSSRSWQDCLIWDGRDSSCGMWSLPFCGHGRI